MKQPSRLLNAFRLAGLVAIAVAGLASIIGTGSGGSGSGYSSDTDGIPYYRDADGDGYGNAGISKISRTLPEGYVSIGNDCNDSDAAIHPGQAEVCGDSADNNCDGQINENCACMDADNDGYYVQPGCGSAVDCNDADAELNPGEAEIGGDGIDNNCNGLIDENINCTDADGDGYYAQSGCVGERDCDDADATVNPGADDRCWDGRDNDCDGQVDGGCPFFPDTGLTACYDNAGNVTPCPAPGAALYGQDGCYALHPPSFTKLDGSGNELPDAAADWVTVRDNVTGLIWEAKTDDGGINDKDNRFAWYTADDTFIARLNEDRFGGFSDWRLPSKLELICLADYGVYSPSIDTDYFPNTTFSYYLSTTVFADNTGAPWSVHFLIGQDHDLYESISYYARAVRGEQLAPSFTDNGDVTVTDEATGLMWSQVTAPTAMNWQQALAWCENASLAGYTDWRLPTVKELASIVDGNADIIKINTAFFPDTVSSYYWTSTTNAYYLDEAWLVSFSYGNNGHVGKSATYYVRAVRGGK